MPRTLRLILVILVGLLTTAGTMSRLHHHTECGDAICFCTDCDGSDDCGHHHDDGLGHSDCDACPYKLDVFKLSADNDLLYNHNIAAMTSDNVWGGVTADEIAEYGCYLCHRCKSPEIDRQELRGPPQQFNMLATV